MAAGSADPFTGVMGVRRGSGRPEPPEPAQPWWRWTPPLHERLSNWLDEVAGSGHVELVLVDDKTPNQFTLRAFREDRSRGYAVLDLDGGEALWLEDHWPAELITERDDDRTRGQLSAPSRSRS